MNIFDGVHIDLWNTFGGWKVLNLCITVLIYAIVVGLLFRIRMLRRIPNQVVKAIAGLGFLAIFYFRVTNIL